MQEKSIFDNFQDHFYFATINLQKLFKIVSFKALECHATWHKHPSKQCPEKERLYQRSTPSALVDTAIMCVFLVSAVFLRSLQIVAHALFIKVLQFVLDLLMYYATVAISQVATCIEIQTDKIITDKSSRQHAISQLNHTKETFDRKHLIEYNVPAFFGVDSH